MKFTPLVKFAVAGAIAVSFALGAQAQTLRMHNGAEPGSLDPHRVQGNWENRIVGDYLEGLMTEDAAATPILGQAESYTVSDDGLVYTFVIRADAMWSDGTPVTAHDFDYAFRRLMDPARAAEYASLQYLILNAEEINTGTMPMDQLGVRVVDDRTIEFTLKAPAPFFIEALTHYTAYPVPRHVVEQFGDDWVNPANIVGNGPYNIVEWIPNSYVRSVRSDTYYDRDNVAIAEVYYYALDDLTAALQRYRAGEFDVMTDFPTDQYQLLQDQYPGQARVQPYLGVYYYALNNDLPELQDVNVRRALSMAINRDVIGPNVLGTGELPAYGWVPPGVANYPFEAYMPDWAQLPYGERVAQATALMEAAGYTAQNPLNIQLRYNTNDNHQRIAVAIAAMWEPIHVNVELFNAEGAVHYDALLAGDYAVGRAGWLMDYNDAINILELLQGGFQLNYSNYNNPQYDALLRQSATITDLAARGEVLRQAEVLAMEDVAALPIYYYVSKNVVSPRVEGYVANAKDIHRTRWLSLAE